MQCQELNERNSDRKRGTGRLANTVTEATTKSKEHENERKEVETTPQGCRQHDGDGDR